jgi:hypothetical protein
LTLAVVIRTLILHSLGRHEFHSSSDAYSSSTFRLLETRASRVRQRLPSPSSHLHF